MRTLTQFIVHVGLPLLLGTCIYVGWRSPHLLVFRWIEFCGLNSLIYRPSIDLPEWVLYSLPDGCWVYAMTSWMIVIWRRLVFWTWIGVALAVGGEIGQLVGCVQGTYQVLDLVFYIGGFVLSGVLNAEARFIGHRDIGHDFSGVR